MKRLIKILLIGIMGVVGCLSAMSAECEWSEWDPTECFYNGMIFNLSLEDQSLSLKNYVFDYEWSGGDGIVIIPESLPSAEDPDVRYKVVAIDEDAFVAWPAGFHYHPFCNVSSVVIPETIVRIGARAFGYTFRMKEIRFPDSVTEIGDECVAYSSSLEYIKLPAGLKIIPKGFAELCTAVTECDIPESVEEIGELAFNRCKSIEKVFIPAGVKTIGNGAFSGMDNLERIDLDPANEAYRVSDGVLYDREMKTLVGWPGQRAEVVIPEGVERIAWQVLNSSDVYTSFDFPQSLTDLSNTYFDSDRNLRKITVRSVTPPKCEALILPQKLPMFAEEVYANAELWVPEESVDEYKAHPVWGKFNCINGVWVGVDKVSAAEEEAVYYSLDGQKVDNPEHGQILIRRIGGAAEKVRY